MFEERIENLNIKTEEQLMTPDQLKKEYPLTKKVIPTVMTGQNTVKRILAKKDHRLFIVGGHVQFMTLRRPENMRAN